MKPNEIMINNQIILNQMNSDSITVKTETHESSPASEALQLILSDSLDNKNLMFDLSKLLSEDQSLAAVPPTRITLNSSSNVQPMLIPRRTGTEDNMIVEMEDTFSAPTPSSSVGAFGNSSSYGASPQQWEQQSYSVPVEVKQEQDAGPGLALSGGSISLSSGGEQQQYFSLQTAAAGPTLAQLNSPPNDELITLKTFGDLDSLNLDLEALTGDLLSQYPVEIKTEYVPVVNTSVPSFTWGRSSNLSTSVPTPVISHVSEFSELSNLSSGGPAVSPNRLTLSPPANMISLTSHSNIPSTVPVNPAVSPGPSSSSSSALHDLLMRKGPEVPDPIRSRSNSNQFKSAKRPIVNRQRNSLSLSNPLLVSQLSKSAPVKNPTLDMIWNRREPRPHMNSICSVNGDSSIADEVSDVLNSLSPSELNDIDSEDEDLTNQEVDSEDDLRIDEEDLAELGGSGRKERFFWQYNVQAKGPKGQKLALDTRIHDPHQLNDIIDPVFSDNVQVHGIKHSGKARRGDGNDLTANPAKLAKIGKELEKLGKDINSMTPVSEVPFPSSRTKSRKEKNKLASRACRLKKKAQHEANKIKLNGLEEEHNELMNNLQQVKRIVQAKWNSSNGKESNFSQEELTQEAEKILKKTQKNRVSGQTTEYVNKMIMKYS